jgi:dihydrofolate reductase
MARRIVMFNRVSADGYFAAPDGNLNWVVPDSEVDRAGAEGIPQTGAIMFGRKTYEMFEKFWPHVGKGSAPPSDPHAPGRQSPELLNFAKVLNESPKIVFSRTLASASWQNSTIAREVDPAAIAAMKREAGKNIIIFGSGEIVSVLTRHGLIDEYHFVVCPVLLGGGKTLLNDVAKQASVKLVDSKTFPSGNVSLRYERSA